MLQKSELAAYILTANLRNLAFRFNEWKKISYF